MNLNESVDILAGHQQESGSLDPPTIWEKRRRRYRAEALALAKKKEKADASQLLCLRGNIHPVLRSMRLFEGGALHIIILRWILIEKNSSPGPIEAPQETHAERTSQLFEPHICFPDLREAP
ncbi:hypothetical protein EYF80_052229 [Liparis tanakae]|uniref:Uncharacterized protein n=1 Tax=Liparis tanakae TaxID=230148 RepID=A0A4Z2F8W3_9TELE|nr:hypothetical protein EYF80_052229 [Liparis tanakae]